MVFINPSNPTGAVFERNHMEELVEICEKYKVPIIADEIYAGIMFDDSAFVSFCEVAKRVPVIHCGGLSKRFFVPGWRVGWSVVHDPGNIFEGRLSSGLKKIAGRLSGTNTLIQVGKN